MRSFISIVLVVLAVILIPFFFFQDILDAATANWFEVAAHSSVLTSVLVILLLAADILLPIPSSLVSTAGGMFLGVLYGTVASWAGMTIACVIGYQLGRSSAAVMRRIPDDTHRRLAQFFERSGTWALVIARPIPVMAEASVLMAGLGRMSFGVFMRYTVLSNLAISMVYSVLGHLAATHHSFLLAFGGAVTIPALFKVILLVYRKVRGQERKPSTG